VHSRWTNAAILRLLALAALFASGAGYEVVHPSCLHSLANGDYWWHLRTGVGILESHVLPHAGLYSQSAPSPWIASSWLYDLAIALTYRIFDLRSLLFAAVGFKIALAAIVFVLAGGLRGRFWPAVALTAAAQYLLGNRQPLPAYCSALAFAVALVLLLQYRRIGNVRALYALPPLFLLWANLDPQFVYGIFLLVLFALAAMLEQWGDREGISWLRPTPGASFPAVSALGGLCLICSMITPYAWKPYGVFFSGLTSAANPYFADHLALRFRTPHDYVFLLLVMAAFLALGMRRSKDIFQIGLLVACAAASFHAQKDSWLVVVAAVALIAPRAALDPEVERADELLPLWQPLFAAACATLLMFAMVAVRAPHGQSAMLAEIGHTYPVSAADFIREKRLPQPLFNSFAWGGFLTWYLPEYPVAIDGRTDLYGADFNSHYAKVMNAEEHYSLFLPLNHAGTLLLEKNSLMATALATVPGFKTVYSDDVAIVLVREQE
jgi:hypothetical protein